MNSLTHSLTHRSKVKKPNQPLFSNKMSEHYTADDLYIGAQVEFNCFVFRIVDAGRDLKMHFRIESIPNKLMRGSHCKLSRSFHCIRFHFIPFRGIPSQTNTRWLTWRRIRESLPSLPSWTSSRSCEHWPPAKSTKSATSSWETTQTDPVPSPTNNSRPWSPSSPT